ncbi:60S ribosomal protein L6-like [Capsicum annuum]|uniref:60S ribosomal protein L6-like n=1 Tax=Capsicum annuum TaxID=4072 RepID=UPI0007BF83F7|nr:60S ribosomal protein L6-like [Capsicum annuum]
MAAKKFPRNPNLINGIGKFFRSKMYHKKDLWVIKKKKGGKFPSHPKSTAIVAPSFTTGIKPPKFYPADDVEKSLINEHKPKPTKLRVSITPGTGLIILAGRFKEKRVVFLKQLVGSGLLLVSGSFKVNWVPLRRVNQAYVIATSTKVNVSGVKIDKIQRKGFLLVDIVIAVHCQKKKLYIREEGLYFAMVDIVVVHHRKENIVIVPEEGLC